MLILLKSFLSPGVLTICYFYFLNLYFPFIENFVTKVHDHIQIWKLDFQTKKGWQKIILLKDLHYWGRTCYCRFFCGKKFSYRFEEWLKWLMISTLAFKSCLQIDQPLFFRKSRFNLCFSQSCFLFTSRLKWMEKEQLQKFYFSGI